MLIKINNPTVTKETSSLSDKADAGTSSLTVLNTDGFTVNDYIILRKIGDEQAELLQISSVSANTLNLTTTISHSHPVGSEIYIIGYNKIYIERKTSLAGTYSVLTNVDIEPDGLQTIYNDTAGQDTYYYRVRFHNTTTADYSSYSNDLKGSGPSTTQAGLMIDKVLERTNDKNGEFSTRADVLFDLNLGHQQTHNALIASSSEYGLTSLEIATEDFKHEYTLPDDFKEIDIIRDGDGNIVDPIPRSDTYSDKGYELTGKNTLYLEDVPEPSSTSTTTPTTVFANNAYDTDGTWVASLDATNVTTDTDEFKSGTGSINFDIDVSAGAGNVSVLTNDGFTAQDLDAYEDTGKWRVWMYLPDVTYITSIDMRWGSSATVYWALNIEKDYKDFAFHDGWNYLEFDWADSAITETGSPVTATATSLDYIQFRINYSASQPDDTDFRLDSIKIANTWDANHVYEIMYFKQPAQVKNEMDEFEIPPGYQYLLLDYAVAQAYYRMPEKDTKADKLMARFDRHLNKFITQAAKRTRRTIGFRPQYTRVYRTVGRDSSRIIHSDGNLTEL